LILNSIEQLREALAKEIDYYREASARWGESEKVYGEPKLTKCDRLSAMIAFEENDLPYVETNNAIFLVKGKYYYVSTTGKWRVKGKQKWYRSKDVYQFIDMYVNRNTNR
jgi:hypothetical protein